MRGRFIIITMIASAVLLMACHRKDYTIQDLQIKELPALSASGVETIYTDSGRVTMLIRAPQIEQYTTGDDPRTIFPQGMTVLFYEMTESPQGSITAHYARHNEKENIWELRDSVVAVSNKGEKLETELLFWSQPKDRIWSDRFVRFTHDGQIVMGTGFDSDSRFTNWTIRNVTGTIYIRDEQEGTAAD